MMKADVFEADLRRALALRAAEVPAAAGNRLRLQDYRPRTRSRAGLTGAGLAAAVLAASGGGYLAAVATGSTGHPGPGAPRLSGATVTLAGYQFTLPAGFTKSAAPCPARGLGGVPSGVPAPGSPWFAAGAAAHDGCVQVLFSAAALTPPDQAVPVQVGSYQGYVVAQPPKIILYVNLAGAQGYAWLVIAASHLSSAQVTSLAWRALSPASGAGGPSASPSSVPSDSPSGQPSASPSAASSK